MNSIKLLNTKIGDIQFAVIDTETTGMNHEFNRVVDIGIVKLCGGKITDKWETLINPKQTIPYWISNFTNIYDHMVINKQEFAQHLPKIQSMMKNCVFVGHNVDFDYSFLTYEFLRLGHKLDMQKLCTVKLGRKLLPNLPNMKLDTLSDYYGIHIENRHRALPDAMATALSLIELIKLAKEKFDIKTLYDLQKIQQFKIFPEDYSKYGLDLF